ncbi:glutaminase family protein [Sunxiuqinia dokdonensis]|uniref:Glutaminase n=1 Tax=Sunxiuqinia dokdonensis TaxID=1409788 RepID=A0A0L8VAL1_9BACT|nr:glutaminase family protein [Sunxiuqinia dokdonensis]KOH45484.1 glutaminase [Sunxiuqinia dokdonensis]
MKKRPYFVFVLLLVGVVFAQCTQSPMATKVPTTTELRAPAYPLITIDPYTSAWSMTDNLYDEPVKHWTGEQHPLIGAVRVDGQVYRFLGEVDVPWTPIVPMANFDFWNAQYTENEPAKGWEKGDFNDGSWKTGKGAFGTPEMPSLGTVWTSKDIWVRREFSIPDNLSEEDIYLIYSHDDIFELYLNGTQLVKTAYEWHNNVVLKIDASWLKPGEKNVIATHCHNRTGGGYVDFGLYQQSPEGDVFTQTAKQTKVSLSATQTHYEFTCGPVDLKLQFVSPLLPDDLDLLSRPVNYINYQVVSNDGAEHEVQVYIEATPEWAVNVPAQEVEVTQGQAGAVNFVKAGTTEQPVLEKKGDNIRIDWGYVYLAANQSENTSLSINEYFSSKQEFEQAGKVTGVESMTTRPVKEMPAMAFVDNLGTVSSKEASGYVMLAYDDLESIQYFGDNLKGWWTKEGTVTINDALQAASADYGQVMNRSAEFDNQLWDETVQAGGENYADLCVLAFRQSIAAHKLVKDTQGNILFLSKENFSNGSIGTVDVTYPSAPLYLKYNPDLLKGMLNPIFYYTESGQWTKPFAAHDVGTYPLANGQTYGGDMPVEESGNMVILTAAIAEMEGNADYAAEHWEALTTWANYLLENGLDPDNQLCTDDFAGHFAHNVNLSVKAIMGIASYGRLAKMLGKDEVAEKYTSEAKRMAQEWMKMADDGDHYRLTFDKPGTWSQKYNLVWDKLMKLDIFPAEVAQTEIAYYLTKQNKYGLPLDNRRTYTKSDWIVWTATLADDQETFQKFIDPLHAFVTETPDRVPMSDWYETPSAEQVGFQARSVVGGYFIKLLEK